MLKIEKDADTEIIEEKCKKACKRISITRIINEKNIILLNNYLILFDLN